MCGRFTLTVDPANLQETFSDFIFPSRFSPRYNIAPTQPILAIPNDGSSHADFFIWGLIPSWAKDPSIGSRMINARSETLSEKPSFRSAYRYRRCLILSDGFYEWKKQPGSKSKVPHLIRLESGDPFAFAGLWEEWNSSDGSQIRSCTIITTQPNSLIAKIHNRMPVILSPENYQLWLQPEAASKEALQPLLKPFPAEELIAYPVSTLVNNPANDSADCITPIL